MINESMLKVVFHEKEGIQSDNFYYIFLHFLHYFKKKECKFIYCDKDTQLQT